MLQYVYCGHVDVESEDIESFEKFLESLKIEFEIEGSDDGKGFSSDDEFSLITKMTPNAEITELDQYCDIEIEEPKWSDGTVKQEPKDKEDDDKSAPVASTSTAAKSLAPSLSPLVSESASNQLPAPRFVKITSQSTGFHRVIIRQRPGITVYKLLTPETKLNIHRATSETRPIAQRPANLQQFERITEYECLGCLKRFPTKSNANEHATTLHLVINPSLLVREVEKQSAASGIPTESCPFASFATKTSASSTSCENEHSIEVTSSSSSRDSI